MARKEVYDSKCKQKIIEQNVKKALLFVGKYKHIQTCIYVYPCLSEVKTGGWD